MNGLPLYIQVRNRIQEGIESGTITPDADGVFPSQQSFAEKYNVSLTTIGKAISELENCGLVVSKRGKGLVLKSHGQGPAKPSNTMIEDRVIHIGVGFFDALRDVSSPFLSRALEGISQFSKEHNLAAHTVSFPELDASSNIDAFFAKFPFAGIDGIILLSPVSIPSISYIIERGIPYASLNLLSDEDSVCHVSDTVRGGLMVTDALLQRRCSQPVFISGSRNKLSTYSFMSGYRMAVEKAGLEYSPDYVCDASYDVDNAMNAIHALLDAGRKVESILGHDDLIAAMIHDRLHSEGITDMLLAGAGNFRNYSEKVPITLDWDLETAGYNITRSLYNMIYGISLTTKKYYYEPRLIVRDWLDR